MSNVHEINVPAKQEDVVHWHRDSGNLVSFIMEMKLRVVIIMDSSLVHHVSKIEEIPSQVVSVWLLFKDKPLVTLLGLYAGASSGARFSQASEVNSLIAKAVNSSTFVVLGGDLNKNGSGRSSNSREVVKTIDYIFVSGNLSSAVADHQVVSVSDFFDTDHRTVMVSVGLGGLLDVQLNSLYKQANRDYADSAKWAKFRDLSSAKLLSLGDVFSGAETCGDVDAMWVILEKAVIESADKTFSKHWFSKFRCLKNKQFSKFFGLELLVAKIVKKFCSGSLSDVDFLVSKWSTLNNAKTHAFKELVSSGAKSDVIVKHLSLVHKDYRRAKMFELRFAEEASIRKAIEKCMENFCSDKDSMIRSVLDRLFHKVVLDYLVVDNELVLKPDELKTSQYVLLSYVRDNVFSGIMHKVNMSELLSVVSGLPDGKIAGLFVLVCMLVLFNVYLTVSVVPDEILMNTRPIALIETAEKIFSKVLSDHISVACSKFDVLWDDNFSVLKGMSTQSSVFAVSSVIEDVLKKNRENMQKAYDLVGWHHLRASLWHIKMCERFIKFFGGIHEDRVNRIMTAFGLSSDYKVHDGLDQGEIFSPLL
ncbi:hypothetical protein G9A89_017246 [Geosiphon pyriformis]|nr:hypothetical protein G9A89_017246 [Geosiphon pyriformis]